MTAMPSTIGVDCPRCDTKIHCAIVAEVEVNVVDLDPDELAEALTNA